MANRQAKPILLASHLASEHIRYHQQPLPWRPHGWSEWDTVSNDGVDIDRIGTWPQSARVHREDRETKAAFAKNSARGKECKIKGCMSEAKYGQRNSAGKPQPVELTKQEIDDAVGRHDKGKKMNSMGIVHKNGAHMKKTLHGGGYSKKDGLGGDCKAFECSQKPHNDELAKLFARNQAMPHASIRERQKSEDVIQAVNWAFPTWKDIEYHDKKIKRGGRNRPYSADDPRNITTCSRKLRYAVEGPGYGGKKKDPEAPWPGQRTTHGALDADARLDCILEGSAHFANNLYKDRYSPRPY